MKRLEEGRVSEGVEARELGAQERQRHQCIQNHAQHARAKRNVVKNGNSLHIQIEAQGMNCPVFNLFLRFHNDFAKRI